MSKPERELTNREIERQDAVDGEIESLIEKLTPDGYKPPEEHDIELTGDIRDEILVAIAHANGITAGMPEWDKLELAFYPYVERS